MRPTPLSKTWLGNLGVILLGKLKNEPNVEKFPKYTP